jgi:hypothetical protein
MLRTRSMVQTIALTILLASCSEAPTGPGVTNIPESPSLAVATHIAGVAFNTGSCTLANSTTGEVRCSWDITNANGMSLGIHPQAHMAITYNCLDSRGQVRSSATNNAWGYLSFLHVTSTSIAGTNQQLVTAVPYNTGTGSSKKFNACKPSQQLQITGYSMLYWHIIIDTPTASACLGSDNRMGCFVA